MIRPKLRHKGFSLAESLVAVIIFGFLITGMCRSVFQINTVRSSTRGMTQERSQENTQSEYLLNGIRPGTPGFDTLDQQSLSLTRTGLYGSSTTLAMGQVDAATPASATLLIVAPVASALPTPPPTFEGPTPTNPGTNPGGDGGTGDTGGGSGDNDNPGTNPGEGDTPGGTDPGTPGGGTPGGTDPGNQPGPSLPLAVFTPGLATRTFTNNTTHVSLRYTSESASNAYVVATTGGVTVKEGDTTSNQGTISWSVSGNVSTFGLSVVTYNAVGIANTQTYSISPTLIADANLFVHSATAQQHEARGLIINLNFADFDAIPDADFLTVTQGATREQFRNVIQTAANMWMAAFEGATTTSPAATNGAIYVNLRIVPETISNNLGRGQSTWDTNGKFLSSTLYLGASPSKHRYFIDPTPLDNSEYMPIVALQQTYGNTEVDVSRIYPSSTEPGAPLWSDLLSISLHEIGHTIGFLQNYPHFTTTISGGPYEGVTLPTINGHIELFAPHPNAYHLSLFGSTFGKERRLMSPADVAVMASILKFNHSQINLVPTTMSAPLALTQPQTNNLVLSVNNIQGPLQIKIGSSTVTYYETTIAQPSGDIPLTFSSPVIASYLVTVTYSVNSQPVTRTLSITPTILPLRPLAE